MTPDNLSLIDSSPTMLDEQPQYEKLPQDEAEGLLTTVLWDGPIVIKEMVQLIWDQDGIDLKAAYLRESKILNEIREENGIEPINFPPWEEIAPQKH